MPTATRNRSTRTNKFFVTRREYDILRSIKHNNFSVADAADDTGFTYGQTSKSVQKMRDRGFVKTFRGRGNTPLVTVNLRLLKISD